MLLGILITGVLSSVVDVRDFEHFLYLKDSVPFLGVFGFFSQPPGAEVEAQRLVVPRLAAKKSFRPRRKVVLASADFSRVEQLRTHFGVSETGQFWLFVKGNRLDCADCVPAAATGNTAHMVDVVEKFLARKMSEIFPIFADPHVFFYQGLETPLALFAGSSRKNYKTANKYATNNLGLPFYHIANKQRISILKMQYNMTDSPEGDCVILFRPPKLVTALDPRLMYYSKPEFDFKNLSIFLEFGQHPKLRSAESLAEDLKSVLAKSLAMLVLVTDQSTNPKIIDKFSEAVKFLPRIFIFSHVDISEAEELKRMMSYLGVALESDYAYIVYPIGPRTPHAIPIDLRSTAKQQLIDIAIGFFTKNKQFFDGRNLPDMDDDVPKDLERLQSDKHDEHEIHYFGPTDEDL